MAKRAHSDVEYSDEDRDQQSENGQAVSSDNETPRYNVVPSLVRMILTRHSRNQKVRREHFTPVLHQHGLKGAIKPWIAAVDAELRSYFGLKLDTSSGSDMCVVSCLHPDSRRVLKKLLDSDPSPNGSGRSLTDSQFLLPRNRRGLGMLNTAEMLQGGLAMLVICLIVVNENRIRESDLVETLAEFGLSENLNTPVANLNKSSQDVLQELTKREYLLKQTSRASDGNNQPTIDYKLGKRTIKEFNPEELLGVIVEIMGEDDDTSQKSIGTLERCFPGFLSSLKSSLESQSQIGGGGEEIANSVETS